MNLAAILNFFESTSAAINWHTTLAGIIASLPVIWTCYNEKRAPNSTELSIVLAAWGIGGLAKDSTTHSTIAQVEKATVVAAAKADTVKAEDLPPKP